MHAENPTRLPPPPEYEGQPQVYTYFDSPHANEHSKFAITRHRLLQQAITWIKNLTGYHVSFHDLCGVTYLVAELELDVAHRSHDSAYCRLVKNSGAFPLCLRCKSASNFLARKRQSTFAGRCHAGVWDVVRPVFLDDAYLGSFFAGGARIAGDVEPHAPLAATDETRAAWQALPEAPEGTETLARHLEGLAEILLMTVRAHGLTAASLKSFRERPTPATKRVHWLIPRIHQVVENRYVETLALSDIAAELKVRPQYLSRIFSRETGDSLTQYIHRFRINKAKQILALGKLNITETAMAVGFDDPGYFTRVFRKLEGRSPTDFLAGRT